MLTIRPAFTAFIRKETGLSVLGPECGQIPTPSAAHDADLVQFAARPTQGAFEPAQDLQSKKTLDTIFRAAAPEPVVGKNFHAGTYQGVFSLDLHAVQGESKLGTLFVDTTPNQEGVQYFFQENKGV